MLDSPPRIAFLSRKAYGDLAPEAAVPAIQRLRALHSQGRIVVGPNVLPEVPAFPPELEGRCRALVCRPTWGGLVTDELVGRLRDRSGPFFIATLSSGTDHIRVEDPSVTVIRAEGGNASQTAELTVFLAICLLRRLLPPMINMGFGVFERPDVLRTRALAEVTWAVIGPGEIGRGVLARAAAMGVQKLWAYDRNMTEAKLRAIYRAACPTHDVHCTSDLAEAVSNADVVTLHVPSRPDTRHMIGDTVLAHFRPSAVLVNMARHEIVDDVALMKALQEGRLGGYAADVLPGDVERHGANPHSPTDVHLWRRKCWALIQSIGYCTHPGSGFAGASLAERFLKDAAGETNIVLTPHIGGSTFSAESDVATSVIDALLARLEVGLSA